VTTEEVVPGPEVEARGHNQDVLDCKQQGDKHTIGVFMVPTSTLILSVLQRCTELEPIFAKWLVGGGVGGGGGSKMT
jgi:hypothetical protein